MSAYGGSYLKPLADRITVFLKFFLQKAAVICAICVYGIEGEGSVRFNFLHVFENLCNGFMFAETFSKDAYRTFFCYGNDRFDIGKFADGSGRFGEPSSFAEILQRIQSGEKRNPGF